MLNLRPMFRRNKLWLRFCKSAFILNTTKNRCSYPEVFYWIGVTKVFTKFTGKFTPLPESLFQIHQKIRAQAFSCELSEIFKNTFFIEHHQAIASEIQPHFDYACLAWYSNLYIKLKNNIQTSQKRWIVSMYSWIKWDIYLKKKLKQ